MASEGKNERVSVSFLKFCTVGVINTGIDFGAFILLFYGMGWKLLAAHGAAFAAASMNSYIMNKMWTFGYGEKASMGQFSRFMAVTIGGFFVSSIVVWSGSNYMPAWLAKILAVGAGLAWNFFGSILFVFRRR